MLLAIDVGNTNIKIGVFNGDSLLFQARLSTDRLKTEDEYAVSFKNILDIHKVLIGDIKGSIVSSVVPGISYNIKKAVALLTGVTPLEVGPGIKTGLNIKIDNPAILGADLVVSCVAALNIVKTPCIIVSMGTATTFSVIDTNRVMRGGAIMPGVAVSLNALTHTSSLLPSVGFDMPKKVIGTNTEDSMRSGCILGTASMIDGMCDRIEEELGASCSVIATGGLSRMIVPHCKRDIRIVSTLMMDGLKIIYDKNINQG